MRRVSRRATNAAESASSASVHRPMIGIGNMSTSVYINTASGAGVAGAAGFHVGCAVEPLALLNNSYWTSRTAGSTGWNIYKTSTTALQAYCADGTSTLRLAAAYTMSSADLGRVTTAMLVHTGSVVLLYVNGTATSAGTAITGYTAAASQHRIGYTATGELAAHFGSVGGATVPDAAAVLAWHNAVKAARRMVPVPGVTADHCYPVTGLSAPVDTIGADNMSFVSTGHTLVKRFSPLWGA